MIAPVNAAVAEEAPLVIVLENFQWIDAESRAALARLPRPQRHHERDALELGTGVEARVELALPLAGRLPAIGVEFVAAGDRYEYHTTYRNVTFNPSLSADTFELDRSALPEDVEVTVFRAYETRDGLANNVSMPVPDPELPEGYALDRANHRDADPEVATLSYKKRDDERPIRIWVIEENGTGSTASNETVRVGAYNATLNEYGEVTSLEWYADGYGYSVSGPVDTETLTRIARSVAESVETTSDE